ncbi:hypothetical protein [Microbulbifer sp. ALW1]|uniref:hypothetical protein n=1 Tax=Microbulbifer sp. (strain ALW1) TaxID=1516059 RepID=UPI00135C11FC|nr:hypothetical protein [Microbulbifer sp. ALW1]
MKAKILSKIVMLMTLVSASLATQAHEGHAPAGVVHEMHHMLWIVMAFAVSAVAVFLFRKSEKKKEDTQD